ncbi:MAG: hypothetical protein KGI33_08855 [Thaumarchaeota archaeon]|nr:hypothetical protein [Nitrososphaerota archaeon]
MYQFEYQTVELAGLKPCPVKVTLQTGKLFKDLLSAAKSHPETIEPITVAVHGSTQYIINGHLRARALREAGRDSARAHIIAARDIDDIVRLHIELNTHGSVNPLFMLDAAKFLKKHDAEGFIPKAYIDLAQKVLYSKVRICLDSFLEAACKKYSQVAMPVHVVKWLVSYESEKAQLTAAEVLTASLLQAKEPNFVFPTPQDLEVISEELKLRDGEEGEAVVYSPEERGRKTARITREEKNLIKGHPTYRMVLTPDGDKLLLDEKTLRVSKIKEDSANGCIKLEEADDARLVYAIPDALLDFLMVEQKKKIRFAKISSRKDLEHIVSSIKDETQVRMLVVLAR